MNTVHQVWVLRQGSSRKEELSDKKGETGEYKIRGSDAC